MQLLRRDTFSITAKMYLKVHIVYKEADCDWHFRKSKYHLTCFLYLQIKIDQMRMVLSPKFHVLGFFVGLSSGFLYGVLSSTQYTL